MKKKDIILIFYILTVVLLFLINTTRAYIETQTINHPYFMGFIKTSILATSGELIASRIQSNHYFSKKGLFYRFIVWGILGMGFVLMFHIYDAGVNSAINNNLLPSIKHSFSNKLVTAFLISLIMNLSFAPAFMLLHRVTDTYIDLGQGRFKQITKVKISDVSSTIHWKVYLEFVLIKTIPLFWVPAHTITFLLPSQYRVLMAGFLSIALGLILSFSKNKQKESTN
ncbi:MAG: Mpv17/PMP22 family protein [Candidatus Izemoplasmatales bacterium]